MTANASKRTLRYRPHNIFEYYGYRLSGLIRTELAAILFGIQLMLAFSSLGFISMPPISITTLPSFVILTAIVLGPLEAIVQGFLFGTCGMWLASVTTTSYGNYPFAPNLSGDPLKSVILSVGMRMLFALLSGLLFQFIWSRRPKRPFIWISIASALCQFMHSLIVYTAMGILFPDVGINYTRAFTNFFTLNHILTYGMTILLVILSFLLFRRRSMRMFFRTINTTRAELNVREFRWLILLGTIVLLAVMACFKHMMSRMDLVYTITQTPVTDDMIRRTNVVFMQFMVAAIGIVVVMYLLFCWMKYYYSNRERNAMEEMNIKLKAALRDANEANHAKTAFLFNMSHDIRTPMNAIIGFTNLLEKNLDNREQSLDYIHKIQRSNDFLLSLINNVLEMARIESGKAHLDETYADAGDIVRSVVTVFDAQAKEKNIDFSLEFEAQHRMILLDETKIREIQLNLLGNAIKYTPPGGTIRVRVEEIPCEKDGYCTYRVITSDTGIGMSEEFLPHIFDEFSRAEDTTKSGIQGTGLGMAIVKKLVDLMGGTITVESKLNEGTTFTMILTHKIAPEGDLTVAVPESEEFSHEEFAGLRILLAEDNELNAEIAQSLLEDAGLIVEHAYNGVAAVEMVEAAEPGYYALVLMDIQMPGRDGYTATSMIRAMDDVRKSSIPIIAMTANAFEEDRQQAINSGMNDHVAKPINQGTLFVTIRRVLRDEQTTTWDGTES